MDTSVVTKKTATLADLETQQKFELEEGVWLPIYLYDAWLGEIKLLNSANNDAYIKKFRSLEKTYRLKHSIKVGKELDTDVQLDLLREAILSVLIVDFRGFKDADGSELPSRNESGMLHKENARKLLNFKMILSQVLDALKDQDNFNREKLEDLEKN